MAVAVGGSVMTGRCQLIERSGSEVSGLQFLVGYRMRAVICNAEDAWIGPAFIVCELLMHLLLR